MYALSKKSISKMLVFGVIFAFFIGYHFNSVPVVVATTNYECVGGTSEGYCNTDQSTCDTQCAQPPSYPTCALCDDTACSSNPCRMGTLCDGATSGICGSSSGSACSQGYTCSSGSCSSGLCDATWRCSGVTGDGNYNAGGDYRCQGTCDGSGNCDYATNCLDPDDDQTTCTNCASGTWFTSPAECCGNDGSSDDMSSGSSSEGCCCDGSVIGTGDDEICPGYNNYWCLDGTYTSSTVRDPSQSGSTTTQLTLSGDDITANCDSSGVICDTTDSGALMDGICASSTCATGAVSYASSTYYSSCASGRECDSDVTNSPANYWGYYRDGYCASTSCCNSVMASGETSSPDWDGGDESCTCGSGDDGEICDDDVSSGAPSSEGICTDQASNTCTTNTNLVSYDGSTSYYSTCSSGRECDSSLASETYARDGRCYTTSCCTNILAADGCDCISNDNTQCDSDPSEGSTYDGICTDQASDTCTTDGNLVSYDGSTSYYSTCSSGRECDSSLASETYARDGYCASTICCISLINSGETSSANFADGDESCTCGAGDDGELCDSSPETGPSVNGICVDQTTSTCATGTVAFDGVSSYYSSCASGRECDTDVDSSGYVRDSYCAVTECCSGLDGELVSGEFEGTTADWNDGDETCGCDVGDDGYICDPSPETGPTAEGICTDSGMCAGNGLLIGHDGGYIYTANDAPCYDGYECDSSLSDADYERDGWCYDGIYCCTGNIVSGETSSPDWDAGDEECGCISGDDGKICDPSPETGPTAEGICTDQASDICATDDVCKSGSSYYDSMASCSDDDPCDSNVGSNGFEIDGFVCMGSCLVNESRGLDESCCIDEHCTSGLVCSSGNVCKIADDGDCVTGDSCNSGYCLNGYCRYPGSLYDGNHCSSTSAAYYEYGMITRDSGTTWDCDPSVASLGSGDYYNDCDQSPGDGEGCDSDSLAGGYTRDGRCYANSCCTNIYAEDGCDCVSNDNTKCDPDPGELPGVTYDGICTDQASNTCTTNTNLVSYDGSTSYYSTCSSGRECDSSLASETYARDGRCYTTSCCTNILAADGCDCISNDNTQCDSDPSEGSTYDGICTDQASDICATDDVCKSGSSYYNSLASCSEGDRCDSDIDALGFVPDGDVFDNDGTKLCCDGTEDYEDTGGTGCCYNGNYTVEGFSTGSFMCYSGEIYDCGSQISTSPDADSDATNCQQVGSKYCDTGTNTWVDKLPNGCPASDGESCQSGLCVDGYCRASCEGYCMSLCSTDGTSYSTVQRLCWDYDSDGVLACSPAVNSSSSDYPKIYQLGVDVSGNSLDMNKTLYYINSLMTKVGSLDSVNTSVFGSLHNSTTFSFSTSPLETNQSFAIGNSGNHTFFTALGNSTSLYFINGSGLNASVPLNVTIRADDLFLTATFAEKSGSNLVVNYSTVYLTGDSRNAVSECFLNCDPGDSENSNACPTGSNYCTDTDLSGSNICTISSPSYQTINVLYCISNDESVPVLDTDNVVSQYSFGLMDLNMTLPDNAESNSTNKFVITASDAHDVNRISKINLRVWKGEYDYYNNNISLAQSCSQIDSNTLNCTVNLTSIPCGQYNVNATGYNVNGFSDSEQDSITVEDLSIIMTYTNKSLVGLNKTVSIYAYYCMSSNYSGTTVSLYMNNQLVGTESTGTDGLASLDINVPSTEGIYNLTLFASRADIGDYLTEWYYSYTSDLSLNETFKELASGDTATNDFAFFLENPSNDRATYNLWVTPLSGLPARFQSSETDELRVTLDPGETYVGYIDVIPGIVGNYNFRLEMQSETTPYDNYTNPLTHLTFSAEVLAMFSRGFLLHYSISPGLDAILLLLPFLAFFIHRKLF